MLTNSIPKPFETIARKKAGVVRQTEVDVTKIGFAVVNPVRDRVAILGLVCAIGRFGLQL